tara:strand:- start:636 stop:851 length:216 start_codon:yes stop_codon:yes gene_type:complete
MDLSLGVNGGNETLRSGGRPIGAYFLCGLPVRDGDAMVGEHEEDDTGAMTLCHFEAIVEVHGAVLSWVAGA